MKTIPTARYEIPTPEFVIGQRLDRSVVSSWIRGQWLQEMIRYQRRMFKKLSSEGYMEYSARLPQHLKAQIRQCMSIIDTAHTIEIVGVAPLYGHVGPYYPYNQCYITSGQCHSGITFGYTLLFRADIPREMGSLTPAGDINYEGKLPPVNTVCILSPTPMLINKAYLLQEVPA